MKSLYTFLFAFSILQIDILSQNLFTLNIANKYYYQTNSTREVNNYVVSKEITDTLSNGFREVTSTYYYRHKITIVKEYWSDTNGKFYINSYNPNYNYNEAKILYDGYLLKDTCIYGAFAICRRLINFQLFGISNTAQKYLESISLHGGYRRTFYITCPEIGIVETSDTSAPPTPTPFLITNTKLIGMVKNGIVIGDTTIFNPFTNIKSSLTLPFKYILHQNYPNPFNPSTKISYGIPESGLVTLKVFDLLGREIATLVNEEKPAGNYEVEFNGIGLTSGIYCYKIQAGNYTEVKKNDFNEIIYRD